MPTQRKIAALLAAMLIVCSWSLTALAREVPDASKKGSIEVTMQEGNQAVPGGSLTIYKVGDVTEIDGNDSFIPTEDFSGCDVSFESEMSAELAQKLSKYAADHALKGVCQKIDGEGRISFEDLEIGLYLLVQEEAAPGYEKAIPFLVSVPMYEDGAYIYHVNASPKVEVKRQTESESVPAKPAAPEPPSLPQTGQLNWPVPVLAVLGLCLFSLGWGMKFGKNKGQR